MTYTGEPSFGIKVRNRTEFGTESNIFKYARNGNIPGIIEMFKQRKASPNDISLRGGQTVLHFPLELGNIETFKFLLDIGVDPYFEDDNGVSVAYDVSSYILTSKGATPLAKAYESTFSGISSSHTELWDFSYLHRVVVGIHPAELSATLEDPFRKSEVNSFDALGRTPLFWAAIRGDSASVKTLLQAGADINRVDHEGRNALHAALQSGCSRSVELLLIAGASVHTRDNYGDAAIQIATWAHATCLPDSNVPILEITYLAGASVNARQKFGVSAIQSAACLDRVANGAYLLSIGADPNNRDNAGDVPIFECLNHNTHGMLALLLEQPSTRFDNVNNAGLTILHFAALHADLHSLDILSKHNLSGVNIEARDKEGRTAQEAFEHRTFPPDATLRRAFERLLENVSHTENLVDNTSVYDSGDPYSANKGSGGSDDISNGSLTPDTEEDDCEDTVFVDALELLELVE